MTEKRFTSKVVDWWHDVDKVRVVFDKGDWIDADGCAKLLNALYEENEQLKQKVDFYKYFQKDARELEKENEQLKKGMIGVVDRYIKNVDCNPPTSARTYGKIKGALMNIREDLRDLIEDLE